MGGVRTLQYIDTAGQPRTLVSTAPLDPYTFEDLGVQIDRERLRQALQAAKDKGQDISKLYPMLAAWDKDPEAALSDIILRSIPPISAKRKVGRPLKPTFKKKMRLPAGKAGMKNPPKE